MYDAIVESHNSLMFENVKVFSRKLVSLNLFFSSSIIIIYHDNVYVNKFANLIWHSKFANKSFINTSNYAGKIQNKNTRRIFRAIHENGCSAISWCIRKFSKFKYFKNEVEVFMDNCHSYHIKNNEQSSVKRRNLSNIDSIELLETLDEQKQFSNILKGIVWSKLKGKARKYVPADATVWEIKMRSRRLKIHNKHSPFAHMLPRLSMPRRC